MYSDINRWFKREGAVFLKDIGVRPGCLVLDFGCGSGHYTIPAAKVVGESGQVYALDQNRSVFDKLMEKAATMDLNNIVAVQSLKELKLYPNADSLDVVLLYDVLHSHYFTEAERKNLLESINKVMKAHSLLSIYPKHMGPIEIKVIRDKLKKLGFYLEREAAVHLIHDGSYDTGNILNFRKE
jgi:SAM-dependent methyltransferase